MHTGRCSCDAINYEIEGELGMTYYCHCSRCRKISGSAFTANAVVSPEQFVVTLGAALLKSFVSANGISRTFCSNCGSHLFVSQGDQMRLRLGTLDTPLNKSLQMHIFTGSKADWFEILDDLPRHEERPRA